MAEYDNDVIPVLVIGAGPHALAFVAKFLDSSLDPFEESPWNSRLFKYNPSRQQVKYRYPKYSKQLRSERDHVIRQKIRTAETRGFAPEESIRIVDTHGKWLRQWEYQFEQLGIDYLRSSVNAHVDPVSWETLRMNIAKTAKHLFPDRELRHVPKNDCYHGPFTAPSAQCFLTFCKTIIHRYNLDSIIEKDSAESISIEANQRIYQVRLNSGKIIRAQHVVLALGPQRKRNWPEAFTEWKEFTSLPLFHSLDLLSPTSAVHWTNLLTQKRSKTRILVIGGGLTSAHLVLALEKQYTEEVHVTLISRQKLRAQAFDINLSWMGRTRGQKLAQFWSEPNFERRVKKLKEAKDGGASVSPEIFQKLLQLQQDSRVTLLQCAEVTHAEYQQLDQQWHVEIEGTVPNSNFVYDAIVCATGTTTSLVHESLLAKFYSEMDFTSTSQAKLTPELRITKGQNIYVLGDAAALQLGPGAVNLMGARAGAARVARAIKTSLA